MSRNSNKCLVGINENKDKHFSWIPSNLPIFGSTVNVVNRKSDIIGAYGKLKLAVLNGFEPFNRGDISNTIVSIKRDNVYFITPIHFVPYSEKIGRNASYRSMEYLFDFYISDPRMIISVPGAFNEDGQKIVYKMIKEKKLKIINIDGLISSFINNQTSLTTHINYIKENLDTVKIYCDIYGELEEILFSIDNEIDYINTGIALDLTDKGLLLAINLLHDDKNSFEPDGKYHGYPVYQLLDEKHKYNNTTIENYYNMFNKILGNKYKNLIKNPYRISYLHHCYNSKEANGFQILEWINTLVLISLVYSYQNCNNKEKYKEFLLDQINNIDINFDDNNNIIQVNINEDDN